MKPFEKVYKPIEPGKANLSVAHLLSKAVIQQATQSRSVASHIAQKRPNRTGLPDQLKSGIENLSGYAMDDVRVHYNSSKPAQLQARAFARGCDIHLAPGQEQYLPHEAWHVVQQKQGRVEETKQLKPFTFINNDSALEHEADEMSKRALVQPNTQRSDLIKRTHVKSRSQGVIQRVTNEAYDRSLAKKVIRIHSLQPLALDQESSAEFAHRSVSGNFKAAYIINAILPFNQVDRIPQVVGAMTAGLAPDDQHRVAIVLGVNGPIAELRNIQAAIERARGIIARFHFPVAIVQETFRGNFPYGTMRNEVLHSEYTRHLTQFFATSDFHPYVSFQDFDTSSRATNRDDGPHIFHAVDRILDGSRVDNMDEANPIRPLMIAGGYRSQAIDDLHRMTIEHLKRRPIDGVSEDQVPGLLANFGADIENDMRVRQELSRIHPMLPYVPEPNLFVDATAAFKPESQVHLEFGAAGAESAHMSGRLAQYALRELEAYYTPIHARAPDHVDVPPDQGSGSVVYPADDRQDKAMIEGLFEQHAQLNRHPQRGTSFVTKFPDMTVATDLSRLAHGTLDKKKLQSHDLRFLASRLQATKGDKSGMSLASLGKRIAEEGPINFFDRIADPEEREKYFKRYAKELGIRQRQAPNPALFEPRPADSPFHSQTGQSHRGMFALRAALFHHLREQGESLFAEMVERHKAFVQSDAGKSLRDYRRQEEEHLAHVENWKSNVFPLLGAPQVRLRVQAWTDDDGDCGFHALNAATGRPITRDAVIDQLRTFSQQHGQFPPLLNEIDGLNYHRWLSDADLIHVAQFLEIQDVAVVHMVNDQWVTLQGNPAAASIIIGGVPAALGGAVNHWVVLNRD